jgi:hypothetical protein
MPFDPFEHRDAAREAAFAERLLGEQPVPPAKVAALLD